MILTLIQSVQFFFYIVAFFAIFKGLIYIINTKRSITLFEQVYKNLKIDSTSEKEFDDLPLIIIALPVVREQAVLKQTLQFFSKLHYPKEKLKILVITSQKEIVEKKMNSQLLKQLSVDLTKSYTKLRILEKYQVLFNRYQLSCIIEKVKELNGEEILNFLNEEYQNTPTTIELAQKNCHELNNEIGKNIFFHIHSSKKNGVMADDLNFAIENLENFIGRFNLEESFLGVYNADSNPNLDTLIWLGCDYSRSKNVKVYQQVAVYLKNFYSYPKTVSGYLLKASSLIQTRWSLGNEVPMLRKHGKFWSTKSVLSLRLFEKIFEEPAAYCIGHGLFIRMDLLKEIGGFHNETFNEDLALGYYLCLKGVGINLLPTVENVENPDTVIGLIKQKATWYWGMIDYFEYLKIAPNKVGDIDLLRIFKITLQGLLRDTLPWGLCSIFISFLIIYPIASPNLFNFFLSIFGLLFYAIFPTLFISIYVPKLFVLSSSSLKETDKSLLEQLLISFFSIPYLLISSIGPWKTIYQKINWRISRIKPIKGKTER